MSVEITRTSNKRIKVDTSNGSTNRITVSHFMWMARELEKAIEEGLPQDAEVHYENRSGVHGVGFSVNHVLVQEIP